MNVPEAPAKVKRYKSLDYLLPPAQPYTELTGQLLHVVAASDLRGPTRAFLLFVIPRLDPVTWSGTFEYQRLSKALSNPCCLLKSIQSELYLKGLVKWTRLEGQPAPLTLQLHAIMSLQPYVDRGKAET